MISEITYCTDLKTQSFYLNKISYGNIMVLMLSEEMKIE